MKISEKEALVRLGEGGDVAPELRTFLKEITRVQGRGCTRKKRGGDAKTKGEK